jgi:hypothetical protein
MVVFQKSFSVLSSGFDVIGYWDRGKKKQNGVSCYIGCSSSPLAREPEEGMVSAPPAAMMNLLH